MGISIPPIVTPQSKPNAPIGAEAVQAFLQTFLASQREKGANSRSSLQHEADMANVDLQKQQLAFRIVEQKRMMAQEQSTAKLLQQWLPYAISTGQLAPQQGGSGLGGFQTPVPQSPMGGLPVPDIGLTPQGNGALPLDTPPAEAANRLSQGADPLAAADFLKQYQPLIASADRAYDAQQQAAAHARGNAAILSLVAPDKQTAARKVLVAMDAGVPKAITDPLVKELFPDQSVTPDMLNAARGYQEKVPDLTFGAVMGAMGRQVPKGLENMRIPTAKPEPFVARPTAQQMVTAGLQIGVMARPLQQLHTQALSHDPGLIASALRQAAKDPKRIDLETVINALPAGSFFTEEDRQYLQSLRIFVDGWVRVTSGAQVNVDEFARFMSSIGGAKGDGDNLRMQKDKTRMTMFLGLDEIRNGRIPGSRAIDDMLKDKEWTGSLSKEDRSFWEGLRSRAQSTEASGGVSVNPFDAAPMDSTSSTAIIQSIQRGRP